MTSAPEALFRLAAPLDDSAGLLQGSGKRMRHVKLVRGVAPDHVALGQLIDDAYADMRRRSSVPGGAQP